MISKLKAEIHELKQRNRDYKGLHDRFLDLKHRYNLMSADKYRAEEDCKASLSANNLSRSHLENERIALIDEKNKRHAHLSSDLYASKDLLSKRETDIAHIRAEIARKQDNNALLRRDIAALEAEGRNLDDVLRSNRLELADLEKANTMRAADHSAHLARIADLNKKVDMSNVDIHVLQNDLAKREQDLDAFRV